MKKVLLVIALMMSWQSVYATPTGNGFVGQWQEYKKYKAGQSYRIFDTAYYLGYVDGVSDAEDERWFSYPKETTTGQLCHVVGKWIDDHPEKWAETPWVIVVTALKEAFPLKKK